MVEALPAAVRDKAVVRGNEVEASGRHWTGRPGYDGSAAVFFRTELVTIHGRYSDCLAPVGTQGIYDICIDILGDRDYEVIYK